LGGGIQNNKRRHITVLNSTFSATTAPYSGAIFNGAITKHFKQHILMATLLTTTAALLATKFGTLNSINNTFYVIARLPALAALVIMAHSHAFTNTHRRKQCGRKLAATHDHYQRRQQH